MAEPKENEKPEVELELPPEGEQDEAELSPEGEQDEAELSPEGEQDDGDEQPPKLGRAEQRIQTLRSEREAAERRAQEITERANKLEQELIQARARAQQAPQETPEQERARLDLMTPEERADYRVNKALERNTAQMQAILFQTQDAADKTAFDARAEANPLVRRFKPEVEAELAKIRAGGGNIQREAVLFYVMGRALYNKQGAEKGKRGEEGRRKIERHTVRASNGRGDVPSGRRPSGDTPEAREKRLESVSI